MLRAACVVAYLMRSISTLCRRKYVTGAEIKSFFIRLTGSQVTGSQINGSQVTGARGRPADDVL